MSRTIQRITALLTMALVFSAGTAFAAKPGGGQTAKYYQIRQDYRKCISPLCGGYWVSEANIATTTCHDGSVAAECYVASIDWSALGLTEDQEQYLNGAASAGAMLVSGTVGSKQWKGFGKLGELAVDDAWEAATANPGTGAAYSLQQTGIVCVKAPCPNVEANLLNTADITLVAPNFDAVGASPEDIAAAIAAMNTGDLLATGKVGFESVLYVSQFYLRVEGGECWDDSDCEVTVYTKFVKNPNQCYCPMCDYQPLPWAEAQRNADSWHRHCSFELCPMPKCMAPPPSGCVDGTCDWLPVEL